MNRAIVCIIGLALFLFSSVGLASAAVDITLKIDGIDGESRIDGHEDEIDVLSWSWGVTQDQSANTGGRGANRASVQDISIVKYVDKASADLLMKCFSGEHIDEAVLTVRKAGENPIDHLVITMSLATVSSVSIGGLGGKDSLTEVITLRFLKVKYSYIPQKDDGSADASIDRTWNIWTNAEE